MSGSLDQVQDLVDGMRAAADRYEEGGLPLERLVWELKSRIAALEGVADREWVEELRSAWWQLEYVNAFWIESGRPDLTDGERQEVSEAIAELRPMLAAY